MRHSIGLTPVAATLTLLMTVPAGYKANVSSVYVNMGVATAKTFTVYWQHAHDATHKIYLSRGQSHATQDSPPFAGNLIMQAGDSIYFNCEAASTPSVLVNFDLYKEPPTVAFGGE